jgi:hypothetical protein
MAHSPPLPPPAEHLKPYGGYTSAQVAELLRRTRQAIHSAGISQLIPSTSPFGGQKHRLYDVAEVENWRLALLRYDGEDALGYPVPPVVQEARKIADEFDTQCLECGNWAWGDHETQAQRRQWLKQAGLWPRRTWCPQCGVQARSVYILHAAGECVGETLQLPAWPDYPVVFGSEAAAQKWVPKAKAAITERKTSVAVKSLSAQRGW